MITLLTNEFCRGDRIRLVNTTLTVGNRVESVRTEVCTFFHMFFFFPLVQVSMLIKCYFFHFFFFFLSFSFFFGCVCICGGLCYIDLECDTTSSRCVWSACQDATFSSSQIESSAVTNQNFFFKGC